MGDIVLGTPGKTVLSESGGSVSWGTGAPTGAILQVKTTTKTDTTSANPVRSGSSGWLDISGMSVNITPISTSSKILIQYSLEIGAGIVGTNGQSVLIKLVRDSTDIGIGDAGTGGQRVTNETMRFLGEQQYSLVLSVAFFLDSPSTTSEITYKLQWLKPYNYPADSLIYLNRSFTRSSPDDRGNTISTILAMEVAG